MIWPISLGTRTKRNIENRIEHLASKEKVIEMLIE